MQINLKFSPMRMTLLGQCVFVCVPVWDLIVECHFHMNETEYRANTIEQDLILFSGN